MISFSGSTVGLLPNDEEKKSRTPPIQGNVIIESISSAGSAHDSKETPSPSTTIRCVITEVDPPHPIHVKADETLKEVLKETEESNER